jgi:hypothetical protein
MFAICITGTGRPTLLYQERRVEEVNTDALKDWLHEHYSRPFPRRIDLDERAATAMCEYLRQFA